ncbi:hypothetical protein FH972_021495 [Carpinus fangiana]|uniref:Uncharacterized protein n=1 Tax=Carpinus fangiana TaxID=176857 RepID=A0A5N6KPG5_9ROSI|nr:hypothetical protein FH972_021495 [Carpinus fangiana]
MQQSAKIGSRKKFVASVVNLEDAVSPTVCTPPPMGLVHCERVRGTEHVTSRELWAATISSRIETVACHINGLEWARRNHTTTNSSRLPAVAPR